VYDRPHSPEDWKAGGGSRSRPGPPGNARLLGGQYWRAQAGDVEGLPSNSVMASILGGPFEGHWLNAFEDELRIHEPDHLMFGHQPAGGFGRKQSLNSFGVAGRGWPCIPSPSAHPGNMIDASVGRFSGELMFVECEAHLVVPSRYPRCACRIRP